MGTRAPGDFLTFVENVGARLRQALITAYGPEVGAEATAEALAYAWEHWERIGSMDNPAGYLYRVGQSKSRWYRRRPTRLPEVPDASTPWVEPGLPKILQSLPRQQRVSVILCHGYGWTRVEVAELLGVTASTVQRHVDRGMSKLRSGLGTEEESADA